MTGSDAATPMGQICLLCPDYFFRSFVFYSFLFRPFVLNANTRESESEARSRSSSSVYRAPPNEPKFGGTSHRII